MNKSNDWSGNSNSIYKTLGASNHTDKEREGNDFYATDPIAIDVLCNEETFEGRIWEVSCGMGHLSKRLIEKGYKVYSSDLVDRGYGKIGIDFLKIDKPVDCNIITNPPYKYATDFIYKALEIIPDGRKVAMFLKLQFMEGKERKKLFTKYPPKIIYVSSSRILCAKNAEFQKMKDGGGSAVAYAWYVWEKGNINNTIIKWVN